MSQNPEFPRSHRGTDAGPGRYLAATRHVALGERAFCHTRACRSDRASRSRPEQDWSPCQSSQVWQPRRWPETPSALTMMAVLKRRWTRD